MANGKKEAEAGVSVWLKRLILDSKFMYLLVAIAFVLFLVTRSPIFAGLSIALLLVMLIGESMIGASEHGAKKEAYEIAVAIAAALAIWYGMGLVLSTHAPLNAVVSCSMLPNLQRGDLVILQGTEPRGIDVYADSFDYENVSASVEGVGVFQTNYSLALYCVVYPSAVPCGAYLQSPEKVTENYGPLEFKHGWCDVSVQGKVGKTQCAKSIVVNGKEYRYDIPGDTIVYSTLPSDWFSVGGSKEIIHRVFMKVHSGGETYYITKGDNNNLFDIQYGNTPSTPERTAGKVITRLPYLGYFKLFLFGYLSDPAGCDQVFTTR